MGHLKTVSICLLAFALHGTAWAEIYETKDAEGNTEFTDSPPAENAEVVDLPPTNIVDAPAPEPQDGSPDAAQPAAVGGQAPVVENNIVIHRDGYDDGVYEDGDYDDGEYDDVDRRELRRTEAVNRADPDAPDEVGDSQSQMPREVGDSESQMPREVGDSESQMPYEVGDTPAENRAMHRDR